MRKGQDNGSPEKSKIFLGEGRKQAGLPLLTAASVVALDQWSKSWIRDNLPLGESWPESGFLRLTHVANTGSAFGLLANQTFLLIITTLAILLIILLFLRYLSVHYSSPVTSLSMVSFGLILGGAIGNLIDRLRFSYVTDFIDVRLWNNFHWPAFNFADAAIVIGIFTLIYFLYRTGLFRKIYDHNRKIKN